MFQTWHLVAAAADPATPYITPGGQIILVLISTLGIVLVALIQSGRKLTKRGVEAAEVAATRSEPTGNGFAVDVKAALARIEQTQRQQGRDIGGIREEIRLERVERTTLAHAVSKIIEKDDE